MEKSSPGIKPSLSNLTIYLYGLGEFGYNFIYTFFSYYLMFFLATFSGLPPTTVAVLYTLVQWIKMLIMPVGGVIVDNANVKSGKYRTLTLLGSVMMAVGLTLMFTKFPLSGTAYVIFFLAFCVLGFLGYSIMYTSHRALMGPMSKNPADGVAMSTAAAQLGAGARIIYGYLIAAVLGILGATVAASYSLGAAICGLIMVACMFVVFVIAKPYEVGTDKASVAMPKKEKLKFKDIIETLKSKPMLIFVFSMILRGAVLTIVTTILVIYITSVLQAPELIPLYMTITYLVQFIGSSIVRWTTNRFGRKTTFIVSTILSVVFIFLVKFFGGNATMFVILMSLFQFTGIFASALMPVFMADIGEYCALTKGSKARGFAFSVGGGALMLAGILGGMIGSFGLVAIGYNAAVPMTDAVANGLTNLLAFGPSALSLLSCIVFFFYPLTEKYMENVRSKYSTPEQAEVEA